MTDSSEEDQKTYSGRVMKKEQTSVHMVFKKKLNSRYYRKRKADKQNIPLSNL